MNAVLNLVYIILAICLLGTVIWAFWTYITLPAPVAWLKGLLMFVLIVIMCYFVWETFLASHLAHVRF